MKKFLIIVCIILVVIVGVKWYVQTFYPNAGRLYDEKFVSIRQMGEEKLEYFKVLVADTINGYDTGKPDVNTTTLNFITDEYTCLYDVGGADYFEAIGFDENIFNHYGNSYDGNGEVTNDTCSLVRNVDGVYEFLLIANPDGDYAIPDIVNYVLVK